MIFLAFGSLLLASAPAEITATIAQQQLPPSAVSFLVVEQETGRPVISQNPLIVRSPASTLKAVTTFASLDVLGPAYTWHTRALASGPIVDGVLEGDLVLQGGGDPYLTLERWWSFAHQLRGTGLRAIHGDVVVDDSAFAPPAEDPGAFDGRPNRAYNAAPSALMVNFQSIQFHVAPNAEQRRVDIVADPNLSNLVVDNRVRYTAGRCSGAASRVDFEVSAPRADRVTFTGRLAAHCAPRELTRVLLTPAEYAYGTFVTLWRELGGSVDGKLHVASAPADARLLLNFDSLSLGEIVRLTNKYSSNVMARHLLLTLGQERFGAPATVAKGIAAIDAWALQRSIDLGDVEIDNGSGLSRSAHISVAAMAAVLRAAYRSPVAPEFVASLPLAGRDGTLRTRMNDSPLGSVRLKTGHIDGVSGVAGYVTGGSGKVYVLVCLINDARVDSGAGEALHAALVKWILENL
ncbi:MAG: D-alanyl-D-alanine carboxypeptidase/D-alanyl-D-alanine-endopeptidase [Steroidobacteraceae bacterium]|jgi:D-alanyl-D-alanine carboxypeptidase/D-alanyl-D-alanine-endopeptidase (penicillin-binding protein 4)